MTVGDVALAVLGGSPTFRATLDRAAEMESTRAGLVAMHGQVIADQVWASAVKFSTETPWGFNESVEAIMSELIVSGVVMSDWDELRRLRDRRDAERALGAGLVKSPLARLESVLVPNRADRRKARK